MKTEEMILLVGAVVLLAAMLRPKPTQPEDRNPLTNRDLTDEEYAAFNEAQAAGNSLLRCNQDGCAY